MKKTISKESNYEVDEDYDSMDENDSEEEKSTGNLLRVSGLKRKSEIDDEKDRKSKLIKQLYKPPTVAEINQMKETENVFHSNIFRMQVGELLKEVRIPKKYGTFIETWMKDFRRFLKTLKDQEEPIPFKSIKYENVKFPVRINEDNYAKDKFQFFRQKNLQLIGSQKLGTNFGKPLHVDLCLEIPESCFQQDDYLNARYHYKRAHYLCHIADALKAQSNIDLVQEIRFSQLKCDPMKPVLEMIPSHEKYGKKIKFILHLVCAEKFKLKRFSPEKNNVRKSMLGAHNQETENELTPTPHMNSSFLFDMCLLKNEKFMESSIESEGVKDAIILLKIWARQRHFDEGYYGFDGALIASYIVYLLQARKIYNTMSCYQIIRLFWNSLARSSWDKSGITLCPELSANVAKYQTYYDVVFLDSTGYTNLCANLSTDLYLRIKDESAKAIGLLNNKKINSFQLLFIQKYPFYTQFDHILSFRKKVIIDRVIETYGSEEDKLNYYNNWYPHVRKMFGDILRRGLGKRVKSITSISTGSQLCWNVAGELPHGKEINFGLILNPVEAFELVDKGPELTNEQAAEDFRNFWGGLSELRRFKDGSITESCVWGMASDPLGEKRLICKQICQHLLECHFNIGNAFDYVADELDVAIRTKYSIINETIEEKSLACIRKFDNLSRILKNLKNLPLQINAILGVDPVFRYAAVDPPVSTATTYSIDGVNVFLSSHVVSCLIQLEASGRWPDKLEAIYRLKAAFYLQIANCIEGQAPELCAQACSEYLDIIYEKMLFRFKIAHQREINLQREYVSGKNNVTRLLKDNEKSLKLELEYNILPKLTSILHGMHQQYLSFGAVVCLAKRWLYSQLIDAYLWPEECTELIIASLYLKQEPMIQPQTGFFRFLDYVAHTDWTREMILLNFNDEMPEEQVEILEKQFATERSSFPELCLITSVDANKYGIFAKKAPTVEILNRVSILAKHSIALLERNFFRLHEYAQIVFTPSYTGYDLIIHLDSAIIVPVNIVEVENFTDCKIFGLLPKDPAAGFNPVQRYLSDLREAYKKFAIFFYDPCGGEKIAVLWRPDALEIKSFATPNISGRCLNEDNLLQLNVDAIINDFKIIGKGLVQSIDKKNE